MYLIILCTAFFQVQNVLLYQDLQEPALNNDAVNNCYDDHGNAIVCPHDSNNHQRPDDGTPCLPEEPNQSLGPGMMRTKKERYSQDSNDCDSRNWCHQRRLYVTYEKVETMYVAKAKCENMGMWLVSIEHEEKWKKVKDAIKASGYLPDFYWTSGQRNGKNLNAFTWGSGCPFTFTNWGYEAGKLQPDNNKRDEDCVEITKDLSWNDFPCKNGYRWWNDYRKSYICESKTC